MTDWEKKLAERGETIDLNHRALNKPRCVCDHGPDDVCVNGYVYTYCESPLCSGSCSPERDCKYVPGCCAYERGERENYG